MASLLKVRGVSSSTYKTSEYITYEIYLLGINKNSNQILAYICRELHLIDNLRIKILIGNDILGPKNIAINIVKKIVTIRTYSNYTIKISSYLYREFIRKKVLSKQSIFILLYLEVILITSIINLLSNRDFLFKLVSSNFNLLIYAYLVDYIIAKVIVRNDFNSPI